ncbi:hypothetical protein EVAR_90326_1 [Eumeta japonica]|uniref:Uncharacterized protein n=1 Tax=Eumeta variegata TaxID=151549 RepID=A0A4C1YL55_EUMVA|nr:hypothetical protein EVAR_90326_1 [Eumeta japonica]
MAFPNRYGPNQQFDIECPLKNLTYEVDFCSASTNRPTAARFRAGVSPFKLSYSQGVPRDSGRICKAKKAYQFQHCFYYARYKDTYRRVGAPPTETMLKLLRGRVGMRDYGGCAGARHRLALHLPELLQCNSRKRPTPVPPVSPAAACDSQNRVNVNV